MPRIIIQVKVLQHIELNLPPKEFIKQPQLHPELKKNYTYDLTVYSKTIDLKTNQNYAETWFGEFELIKSYIPFKIKLFADYGDTFIGCITDPKHPDIYFQIFDSEKIPHNENDFE
jgi:hypothetical protein